MNGKWFGNTQMGDMRRIIGQTLRGLNIGNRQLPPITHPKDQVGLVFFTRPQLNLSTINIKAIRQFKQLLTLKSTSIPRYVRTTLDPRLQWGIASDYYNKEQLDCPLTDMFNPFIPVLSNLIKTMSGWPDMVVPSYTSSSGMRKEQFSMVDGAIEIFDSFDISCTFKNIINEPLTLLFQTWLQYSSFVFEGMLNPYLDYITEFEIDYNTRIYRFVTDESGKFIKKAACTGASYPKDVPLGKFFDYNREDTYSTQTEEINISFTSMGALYNDIKIFFAFNKTWEIFNPFIKKWFQGDKTGSNLEEVPYDLLPLLNYRAYPVIDIADSKFIWLISKDDPQYKLLTASANASTSLFTAADAVDSFSLTSEAPSETVSAPSSIKDTDTSTTTPDVTNAAPASPESAVSAPSADTDTTSPTMTVL